MSLRKWQETQKLLHETARLRPESSPEICPMGWILNGIYALGLLLVLPWLLARSHRRKLLPTRLVGGGLPSRPPGKVVWFHGVSVGEIILLETLLREFTLARPDVSCVVSCSTDSGMAEAKKRHATFSPFPFPFDFTFSVNRALDRIQPCLIVLAESELWPNFLHIVDRRGIPLAVINGRMSPKSLKRWQWFRFFARPLFQKVACFGVQQIDHATALANIGVAPERILVTGSVKFDHASQVVGNPKILALREFLKLVDGDLLWVVGSTQPPEEKICIEVFQKLRNDFPLLRLAIVPRDPTRGSEVATFAKSLGFAAPRRSLGEQPTEGEPITILDTIGELGTLWNLATFAYVGGSLDGKRGGQNMIEPAALGLVPLFGPHVWNFQAIANALVGGGMADRVNDQDELLSALRNQLIHPEAQKERGIKARQFVLSQQGATKRTVEMLSKMIPEDGK